MKNVIEFPEESTLFDEASAWIIKMTGDEPPSATDIAELNAWVAQSPEHRAVYQECASTWDGLDLLSELRVPNEQGASGQSEGMHFILWWLFLPLVLVAEVFVRIVNLLKPPVQQHPWFSGSMATAASLGLMFLLVLQPADNLYVTSVGEQSVHQLEDGSTLWLNTNSQIEIDYSEQRRRRLQRGAIDRV